MAFSNSNQNLKSSFGSFGSGGDTSVALPERLLHEADRRREKRERLKREQELQLMEECSF